MPCDEYGFQVCQLENIRALLQKYLTNLPRDWTSKKNEYRRAALLLWLVIHGVEVSNEEYQTLSVDILNPIYKILQSNSEKQIRLFYDFVPSLKYLDFWISRTFDRPLCNVPGLFVPRCLFGEVLTSVSQFSTYLQDGYTNVVHTDFDIQKELELEKSNDANQKHILNTLDLKADLETASNELKMKFGTALDKKFNVLGSRMTKIAALRFF